MTGSRALSTAARSTNTASDTTPEQVNVDHGARFGVNYVPGKNWWYSWVDWDPKAIDADLKAVSSLGMDHIRIHCLWPVFQPNATYVSDVALQRLESLLDIADQYGLDVIVTVFNGWLSGFDFRPDWVSEDMSVFSHEDVLRAQGLLLEAIAARVASHVRFLGFDLANEPSVIAAQARNRTTSADADRWLSSLLATCEQLAPGRLHSVGMDHLPWITDQSSFSRATTANTGTVTAIHAWSYFTGALERYGPSGVGTLHLPEYMLELAKAYQDDPDRPVWLQETGVALEWMTAQERETFVEQTIESSLSVPSLWGITWWCSHDIDRRFSGFAELEYDLGLLTVENHIKPLGASVRDAILAARAASRVPTRRSTALVLPRNTIPDLTFADRFFTMVEKGIPATIVLEERVADSDHLAGRGIETIETGAFTEEYQRDI